MVSPFLEYTMCWRAYSVFRHFSICLKVHPIKHCCLVFQPLEDLDETTATTSPVVKLPRVNTPSEKVSHRRSAHPCDRVKRQLNFPYQSFRHKRSSKGADFTIWMNSL